MMAIFPITRLTNCYMYISKFTSAFQLKIRFISWYVSSLLTNNKSGLEEKKGHNMCGYPRLRLDYAYACSLIKTFTFIDNFCSILYNGTVNFPEMQPKLGGFYYPNPREELFSCRWGLIKQNWHLNLMYVLLSKIVGNNIIFMGTRINGSL